MNTITCPECHAAFTLDGAGYAQILQQVHNDEFEKAVAARLVLADEKRDADIDLAVEKAKAAAEKQRAKVAEQLAAAKKELADEKKVSKAEFAARFQTTEAAKDAEIAKLRADLEARATAEALAVAQAVQKTEVALVKTKAEVDRIEHEKAPSERSLKEQHQMQLRELD